MKLKFFGALVGAAMLALAAPAGAATVSGTNIVNALGTITPKAPATGFSPSDLTNGVDGINGADYTNGKHYFDYVFSFSLPVDANVKITGDQTAGTNVLDFHAALFSSSPVGTDLLVGSSPNKFISLTDTTNLLSEDETSGGTTYLTSLNIGPGTYYLRLFGTIAGSSANSVLTSLHGTVAATPVPASLLLLMTSLGAMGFMVWRRPVPAGNAAA
ncbi:MAG TPA: hypothetical protein VHE77_07220 [Dongiaceae bacterium]|jgi:hypothetical protein|nr:hypothetical protein [Dongiaceae bacterium]